MASYAADDEVARRWLDQSDDAAGLLEPSGVYASYSITRLRLAQARVYASLGDVENTRSRLPYGRDPRPEWSSGGDGMVRELIVSVDLDDIHQRLLEKLATGGRIDEALQYVEDLNEAQQGSGIHLQLGRALAQAGISDQAISVLPAQQQANARAGFAWAMLEAGRLIEAKNNLMAIKPREQREQTVGLLVRTLMANNVLPLASRTLELDILSAGVNAALVQQVVSTALRTGDATEVVSLVQRIEEPGARDNLDAQLAYVLATAGDHAGATEVFDNAPRREASTWEQVAMLLENDAWLEERYLAIENPWRRTERLYQFALRKLAAGERREAERLADLCLTTIDEIPSSSTRWLALRLLAEYHARAANPAAAAARTAQIPTDGREAKLERGQALAAVVEAWARAGDTDAALREADRIEDPVFSAISTGRRNTLAKSFGWCFEV